MPQNKFQIPEAGPNLFQTEMIRFARKWREPIVIHKEFLDVLATIAADTRFIEAAGRSRKSAHACPKCKAPFFVNTSESVLVSCYRAAPDLTLELLTFLREQWRKLDKSKAGRLRAFLSTTTGMKTAQGEKHQSRLTDGEIALAYEETSKENVNTGDVVQARRAVIKKLQQGKKLAGTAYDKDGFLRLNKKHKL
jgi:hypothetical protein